MHPKHVISSSALPEYPTTVGMWVIHRNLARGKLQVWKNKVAVIFREDVRSAKAIYMNYKKDIYNTRQGHIVFPTC